MIQTDTKSGVLAQECIAGPGMNNPGVPVFEKVIVADGGKINFCRPVSPVALPVAAMGYGRRPALVIVLWIDIIIREKDARRLGEG